MTFNNRPSSVTQVSPFDMLLKLIMFNPKYRQIKGTTISDSARASASLLHDMVVAKKNK